MERLLVFFILLFPLYINAQVTEAKGLFIYDEVSKKTTWLDENGKVVKIFGQDYIPKLSTGKFKPLSSVFIHNDYAIHHFAIGFLPVKYKDTWQFYDAKGIWIMSPYKPYQDVSLASQGYYIGTVKDSLGKDAYVYFDSKGKELFQGRVFTETSEFRNHIAFAAKDDTWYILKARQNSCILLKNEALQPLYEIKRNTALYSQATVGPPDSIQKFMIDTMGQISYSASMCGEPGHANIGIIDDQLIICNLKYVATFYDMQGKVMLELRDVDRLEGIGDGLVLFRMQNGEKRLFDFKMNPVTLNVPPNKSYTYHDISTRMVVANVQDSASHQNYLGFFDSKSKTQIYQMAEDNFGGLIGNKIIYANWHGWKFDFLALVNLDGKVLYAQKNKEAVYNIVNARFFPKTDVQGLVIFGDEGIERLPEYQHVKTLEFQACQFEELPACVCQFQNLQSITLTDCNKLIRLPTCLGKLPYFNDLLIKDCTNLTELEAFLMNYPKKTLIINTEGHYFSEGFNRVIEEKLPHIKLTSWTDNWFYNDTD